MEKLKLDKRATKAVRDSIVHWKRDIQAKLIKGIKIRWAWGDGRVCLVWEDNGKKIECYSKNCPLCKSYAKHDCVFCPYYRKYSIACLSLHWRCFINKPCLKTCNKMIVALENILK